MVVGLGPGDSDLMAPRAREAIETAQVIVGYKGYISLMDSALLEGKEIISTGMKGEMERCNRAIYKALGGRDTVVVSSGDPGIYGMAGLVLELLDKLGVAHELEVEIIPGISALAAAAALLGAPLMHDFAVISLSDLLTPWEVIIKRIEAALEADFVLVIYNPRSKKRAWQLGEALKRVKMIRGDDVPVGVVRNASRQGQEVKVVRAKDVDESSVDMLSIIFVGNSQTRVHANRMITPRGYLEKYSPPQEVEKG